MNVRIAERREPAPEHVELLLDAPELAAQLQPGQFAHVYTGGTLRRPISFSRRTGGVGLLFRVVGVGTDWLGRREPGSLLDILAPLGRGFPTPPSGPVCLVGGGVGIPPIFLYAETHQHQRSADLTVILGARTREALIMRDDFRHLGLEPIVCTDDGSEGETGRVTGPLARWLERHPGGSVFACGPTPMLAATGTLAAGRPTWLAFEQRMGCGIGACLACVVPASDCDGRRWLRVCHDGPVFAADDLWLASGAVP